MASTRSVVRNDEMERAGDGSRVSGVAALGAVRKELDFDGRSHADLLDQFVGILAQTGRDRAIGLAHEIHRAQFERVQRHLGPALCERGDHHHRHGPQPHQIAQEGQPVHARHLDIEREHIGIEFLDAFARHIGVLSRTHHLDPRGRPQDLGQQLAHQGRVVDDKNTYHLRSSKSSMSPSSIEF